jgi:predicted phosphodiesterase
VSRAKSAFAAELFESPHSFEIGGRRILLVHDIGDVNKRSIASHEIVIHGSTHQQEMKTRGDTLIVNPGEGCGWIYGTPSAAILDLDSRNVQFLTLATPDWKY